LGKGLRRGGNRSKESFKSIEREEKFGLSQDLNESESLVAREKNADILGQVRL